MESPKCHVGKYSRVKIVKYRVKNPAPGEADKDTDFCFFLKYSDVLCSGRSYPLFFDAYLELGRIENKFINALSEAKDGKITPSERERLLQVFGEKKIHTERLIAGVIDDIEVDYDAKEAVEQAKDEMKSKEITQNTESSNASRASPLTKKSKH